ncbi:tetratricopeptide repeat protein [Candidatus Omnitrophota bacterium]
MKLSYSSITKYSIFIIVWLYCGYISFAADPKLYQLMKEAEEFYKAGEFGLAEENCKRAIEIDSQFFHAYNILGSIYSQQVGLEDEALSYFKKSLTISDTQVTLYNYIGALYSKIGKLDEASYYYEKGLEYSPDDFFLNFNLGILYLINKHDAYKAIQFLQTAQKQKPRYVRLLYLTGVAHMLTGADFAALESVTLLREEKEEYLASRLENIIRKYSQGETVDLNEAIQDYSQQPKLQYGDQSVDASVDSPTATMEGTGKLTIKTQLKKEGEGPAPGIVTQSGSGTIRTRVNVGGTGTIRLEGRPEPISE